MAFAPGTGVRGKARAVIAAAALSGVLAGCASTNSTSQDPSTTSSTTAFTPIALPMFGRSAPGKPSEVYVRIARLAKQCWFAAPAPLQSGYVFTADVSPDSKGGQASIVIFEHNAGQIHGANAERGAQAFQVTLTPNGDQTSIGVENTRIPEAFAERMKSDIDRWAAGETSCGSSTAWSTTAAIGEGKPVLKPAAGAAKLWRASTN